MGLKEFILFTCLACINYISPEELCDRPAILELSGDAVISGFFHIHNGQNCSRADPIGLQQMAASAWVVNTLNKIEVIPSVKIGFAVYDACSTSLNDVIRSSADNACKTAYNLGLLTTPEITEKLHLNPISNDSIIFLTDKESPEHLLLDITINLLLNINWTVVDYVLAPSDDILSSFNEKTYSNRICVLKQITLPDFNDVHWSTILSRDLQLNRNYSLIIVYGTWEQLYFVTQSMSEIDESSVQWILVPLNSTAQQSDIEGVPINSLLILPGIGILQERRIREHANMSLSQEQMYDNITVHQQKRIFISYPLFMDVALPILKILMKFQETLVEYCSSEVQDDNICPTETSLQSVLNFNYTSDYNSKTDVMLHMILSSDYTVVTAVSRVGDNHKLEDFAVFEEDSEGNDTTVSMRIINNMLHDLFRRDFCDDLQVNDSEECSQCSNFVNNYHLIAERTPTSTYLYHSLTWRPDAWVAALASIASVGIICAIAITIFISVRICKGDLLEGNPVFSYLLLLSITFTYLSTLPYSFNCDEQSTFFDLFCILRVIGPSLSYAFLFSIMLTRCLMLAVFDNGISFMNHINGFMQSVLCFFILGVQVALSVQILIIKTTFFTVEKCTTMYEGYNFQILLSYDIFLLLLLVCTSPFSVRAKRNYSEGMFFTIASYLCLLIWISWTLAYLLLSSEWKDIAISGGLTATATVILVSVFIPRTYLMMTAIVRDNLASALPSLACTNSTSILDINYRTTSNQVLYDCVNPFPGEQLNPNFYSEQPHAGPFGKSEDIDPISPESTYEMYDSPASPSKVTHF